MWFKRAFVNCSLAVNWVTTAMQEQRGPKVTTAATIHKEYSYKPFKSQAPIKSAGRVFNIEIRFGVPPFI